MDNGWIARISLFKTSGWAEPICCIISGRDKYITKKAASKMLAAPDVERVGRSFLARLTNDTMRNLAEIYSVTCC